MKKIFLLFLVLVASIGTIFAESGTCGENLSWDLTDGVLIISGTGPMENYSLYKKSDYYYSTAPWFPYITAITSVLVNDGITKIGDCAFYRCSSMASVIIPNSVTSIGNYAFTSTGLTSVTIPNSVTSIGNYAFAGTGLTSVTIPNSVTSIGDRAFVECHNLSTVILGNGITSIGECVFYSDFAGYLLSLTNIYVPCGEILRYQSLLPQNAGIIRNEPMPYSLTINTSANGYVRTSSHSTICDSLVILDPIPYYGYHFIRWSDGDINNPRTIELTQDTTFEAIFAVNKYSILVTCDSQQGSIEGESGEFDYLTELTYKAVPNYGYHFDIWSDGNIQNPRTITVYADSAITALFTPNKYLIQDGSNSSRGNISGIGSFDYKSKRTITAIPSRGYYFVKWADGNTDNPRIIELTQDTTMEAIFDYLLTSKCGKDSALAWTLDTTTLALNITGKGALSENYTYGTFIKSLTIGNEVTIIGQSAFSGCNNLKNVIIGSSVKVLEEYAFFNCSSIETITCYSQRPPTVNNNALSLDYSTIIYVPADYLETYKMHDAWGLYDVRPIGASTTTATDLSVTPTDNTVDVVWPAVEGAATYELIIKDKEGNAICTLIFNANGQLTSIAFHAPSLTPQQTQATGFSFTVTGLESGTNYDLTMTSKDNNGTTLQTQEISFTTTVDGETIEAIDQISQQPNANSQKLIKDGQLFIFRGEKVYTLQGQEVR